MPVLSRLFSGNSATRPPGDERSGAPAFARGLRDKILAALGWQGKTIRLPRAECHRLTLSVKDIPKRLLASTIRLQLLSLTGLRTFGFAWRADAESAEIWYWDESTAGLAASDGDDNIQPVPEMLWRKHLDDGLYLVTCLRGHEALAIDQGRIRRSRWFATPPNNADWQGFVRDAGKDPGTHPLPQATACPANERHDATWKIVTTRHTTTRPTVWIAAATIVVLALALSIQLTRDLKYGYLISRQKETLNNLRLEKSAILQLQKQIADHGELPERISKTQPKILQLRLMQALADTGLFDEGTQISLLEWEYRNEKLRLMFLVPKDNFSLGLFLSTLESSGILEDVRLMPDTPAQTIGIQAGVRELTLPRPATADTRPAEQTAGER